MESEVQRVLKSSMAFQIVWISCSLIRLLIFYSDINICNATRHVGDRRFNARERWSEWKSEFPIQFNTKLVHYASRAYQIMSNHFQSLLPSCIKRFTTKGEQTLSDVLEKLLITKAIYQLNKYNKAWLNTNLAKTLNLFTVGFQESLQIFWEKIHRNFLPCIRTLRFRTRGFLHETGFLRLSFSTTRFIHSRVF